MLWLLLAITPGIIGGAALVGWHADMPTLNNWGAAPPGMRPLTAAWFIALSLALILSRLRLRSVGAALGYAVAVTAIASLLQDAGFIRLGIDQWLAPAYTSTPPGELGWAPVILGTVALLLAGIATVLRRAPVSASLTDFLAAGTGVIGLVTLLAHLFDIEQIRALSALSIVPVPTGVALCTLALGSLSAADAGETRRSFSLRDLIVATVVLTAVPLFVLSLSVLGRMVEADRASARVTLMQSARSFATLVVEGPVSDHTAILHTLASSRSLLSGDMDTFRAEAERAFEFLPGSWLVVSEPGGQQLLNTRAPAGTPLPRRVAQGTELQRTAFAARQPQLSGLFEGPLTKQPIVALEFPVFRDGQPLYSLTATIDPSRFERLIQQQNYPREWIIAVIDPTQRFVARVPGSPGGVGSLASEEWRKAIARQPAGFHEIITVEGVPTVTAYVPTKHGWTVGVAVPLSIVNAPANAAFWRTAAFGAALTAFSILLASFASRRIARPAGMLNEAAIALRENRPVSRMRTGVSEFDAVTDAFAVAARQIQARDAALREVTQELSRSEERLRLATESAGVGWFDYDVQSGDGVWAKSNFAMLGYAVHPEGSATYEMWHSRLHPEDADRVLTARVIAERDHTPYNVEYRVLRADDGQLVWLHANGRLLYDENGTAVRFVGVLVDISDRKRAEEAVRANEERLRLATQAWGLGWFDIQVATGTAQWSRSTFRILGYDPTPDGSATLDMWRARLHPADAERVEAEMEQARQTHRPYRSELRIVNARTGQSVWLFVNGRFVYDHQGVPRRFVGILIDITDRKRAEDALRASEERLRIASDAAGFGSYDFDPIADRSVWSPQLAQLVGAPDTAGVGSARVSEFIHPDDRERVMAQMQTLAEGLAGEVYELEFRILRPDGEVRWVLDRGRVWLEPHDGDEIRAIRITGTVLDITERKESEEAVLRAQQRLELAQMAGHVGVWSYEPDTGYVQSPVHFFQTLGYTEAHVHPTLADFRKDVHPDDLVTLDTARSAERNAENGASFTVQIRFKRRDGTYAWLERRSRVDIDSEGHRRVLGVLVDTSDRRTAEEALRESEARFATAFQLAPVSVAITTVAEGRYVDVNEGTLALSGYTRNELIGRTVEDVGTYADPEDFARVRQLLKEHGRIDNVEIQFKRKNGEIRTVLMSAAPVSVGADGHVLVAAVDITERKRSEAAAALLAALVTTSTDAIASKSLDGTITSWNAGAERLFGFTAAEMIGRPALTVFPPDRHAEEVTILTRIRAGETIRPYETVRVTKAGEPIAVSVSVSPIRGASGQIIGASTITRDISEQKRVEAALRESEARLRAALHAGDTGTFHWDIRANALDWDPALQRLFGLTPDANVRTLDDFIAGVHPDDRAAFIEQARRSTEAGDDFELEFRVVWPDHSVHWLYERGKIELGDDGRPASMTGACVEITKRKSAEEKALRAFGELESIYSRAPVGLCVLSPDGRYLRINERLAEINGLPAEAHFGRRVREVVPQLADETEALLQKVVNTGEPLLDIEISGETPAQPGVRRTWLQQWSPVKDESGRLVAINVVAEEITARKEAEDALARSNALLRALTDTTPGLIYVKDRENRMVLANPATLNAIGKTWDEVRGRNELEWHVDPKQATTIIELDRRVMESGEIQSAEEELTTPDGIRTFYAVKSPLRDPSGSVVGVVGISTDITDRKQAEEHLNFVLRELSHRTKNLFAVVLAIANQTARQVNNFGEFSTRFAARVEALARAHDLLVHSDWTGAPISEVVRAQTSPFTDRVDVSGPAIALKPEAVQNLSLALHELATNAVKYGALSNGQGKISVKWTPVHEGDQADGYLFEWRESGGPAVVAPQRRGFGSTVLLRISESSFGGPANLEFDAEGVRWTLRVKPQHVVAPERLN